MEELAKRESRYKFIDNPKGFTIDGGEDRKPTTIELVNHGFYGHFKINNHYQNYGLFDFHSLISATSAFIMSEWKPKQETKFDGKLKTWAKKKTAMALSKKIAVRLRELHKQCDPTFLEVSRKCFAVMGKTPSLLTSHYNEYYGGYLKSFNAYTVKDILKFRAAALAVHFDDFSHMDNWREVYYGEHRNASLDKTLNNLPGGIGKAAELLGSVRLERPMYDRLELLCLLKAIAYSTHTNYLEYTPRRPVNEHIFIHTKRPEIQAAAKVLGEHLRQPFNLRKTSDIVRLVTFLKDFPDPHNGNIVGLTRKSIEWHRTNYRQTNERQLRGVAPETLMAVPPIPLPQTNGVTFLKTANDLVNEGVVMGHCVASYIPQAMRGHSFIFHVEHQNELATVEVSPRGVVVQAQGPNNRTNKATQYGQRKLNEWAKGMKPLSLSSVPTGLALLNPEYANDEIDLGF